MFDNARNDNLGMPLPAGIVRTYQHDSNGYMQFIGEDSVDHTAENENIKLFLGESFDVNAKRKQIDYDYKQKTEKTAVSEVKKAVTTVSYEVIFNNAKDTEEVVLYEEHFFDEWNITKQSLNSEKINSSTNRWRVKIPAKSKEKLRLTVQLTYLK